MLLVLLEKIRNVLLIYKFFLFFYKALKLTTLLKLTSVFKDFLRKISVKKLI